MASSQFSRFNEFAQVGSFFFFNNTYSHSNNKYTIRLQVHRFLSLTSMFCSPVQAASCLKQHESLRQCRRCGSPAIHLPEVQRATCTRSSCLFDFCTCCQEGFHGSTPCRTVQPKSHFTSFKMSSTLPGSARSKRSLRRLWWRINLSFIQTFLTVFLQKRRFQWLKLNCKQRFRSLVWKWHQCLCFFI